MSRLDALASAQGDLGLALFKVAKMEEAEGGALASYTGTLRQSGGLIGDQKRAAAAIVRASKVSGRVTGRVALELGTLHDALAAMPVRQRSPGATACVGVLSTCSSHTCHVCALPVENAPVCARVSPCQTCPHTSLLLFNRRAGRHPWLHVPRAPDADVAHTGRRPGGQAKGACRRRQDQGAHPCPCTFLPAQHDLFPPSSPRLSFATVNDC